MSDNRVTVEVTIKVGVDPLDAPSLMSVMFNPLIGTHVLNTLLDKCHIDSAQFRGATAKIDLGSDD